MTEGYPNRCPLDGPSEGANGQAVETPVKASRSRFTGRGDGPLPGFKGSPLFRQKRKAHQQPKVIGYLGAPLVDGQNLSGADLAPLAIRDAGFQTLVEKLGFDFKDYGDLDFQSMYREKGLNFEAKPHPTKTFQEWQEWMRSGAHSNFAEWSLKKDAVDHTSKLVDTSPKARENYCNSHAIDVYEQVVNAELIGPALELVYRKALEIVKAGHFLLTIGGDHSIATPTIAAITRQYPNLSIIWIDAHADANTPITSPSLHYHGMPAGHLLGWFDRHPKGFEWMPTGTCVEESHFAYIGLRDIDDEEGQMLRNSDVNIFTMWHVDKYGISKCIDMALQRIDPNGNRPLHLSLDVDGIDPSAAPGTGTCARGGLMYREIHFVAEELARTKRLVSMDLVEINPALDAPNKSDGMHGDDPDLKQTTATVQLGVEVVLSALGKTILGD